MAPFLPSFALSAALGLLPHTAKAPAELREVGEDYQVDYAPDRATPLYVETPVGARVEVLEGAKPVAAGTVPFAYRGASPGTFIVSLRLADARSWETHVVVHAGMRAVLHASPGARRTRVTILAESRIAPLSDSAFAALCAALAQVAPSGRYARLVHSAKSAKLSASQTGQLLDLFHSSSDKWRVLTWAHRRMVDPVNGPGLSGRFALFADRRRAQARFSSD